MQPKYPVTLLSEMLPTANLIQIREIRETMQRERNMYDAGDYVKAFTLLSDRLIELTYQRPKNIR